MRSIKGLLIKDFLLLKAYKKNLILGIFIYIFIMLMNASDESIVYLGTSMIVFLFSSYAISTFNIDEKSESDKFYLTLPINKKYLVLEKYLFVVINIILGMIISFLIVMFLYTGNIIHFFNIKECLLSMLSISFGISIYNCLQIPCIYKFGVEKGRLQIYIIIMIIFLVIGGCYFIFKDIDILRYIDNISRLDVYLVLFIIFLYIGSYFISLKFFRKREF